MVVQEASSCNGCDFIPSRKHVLNAVCYATEFKGGMQSNTINSIARLLWVTILAVKNVLKKLILFFVCWPDCDAARFRISRTGPGLLSRF